MTFSIERFRSGCAVALHIPSLDRRNCGPMEARILDLITHGEVLVIDLSAVSYIDSRGLAFLLKCLRAARREDATVAVAGLTPPVRSMFGLIELQRLVRTYATRDAAVRDLLVEAVEDLAGQIEAPEPAAAGSVLRPEATAANRLSEAVVSQ